MRLHLGAPGDAAVVATLCVARAQREAGARAREAPPRDQPSRNRSGAGKGEKEQLARRAARWNRRSHRSPRPAAVAASVVDDG
eukprot:8306608-Pyramimonas_sp.AAC.1